jgi:hypothetical protein
MRARYMRRSARCIRQKISMDFVNLRRGKVSKRVRERSTIRASGQRIRNFTMKNFIDSSPKFARINNVRRNRRSME